MACFCTHCPPVQTIALATHCSGDGGAHLSPTSTQHYALHATPFPGDQSFGLVGAQYPTGSLPGTAPTQQLLLKPYAPPIAQHIIHQPPLHQFPTPAYIPFCTTPLHRYTGHYVAPPGDAMVDQEEHLGATQSTYVVPAPATPSPSAANLDPYDDRFAVLEKALRQVQGTDHHSYQFRDLCYFPEVVLASKFRIPDFEKYNSRGCPIAHMKAYYGDLAQLQADDRLLICLFQKSLTGPALKWFTSLDMATIKTWNDLSRACLE